MKRLLLSAHIGLVIVGITATAALLLETRLSVSRDVHFLLEILWVAVAIGAVFVVMIQPALQIPVSYRSAMPEAENEVPEWRDADRVWMQQHPHERYSDKRCSDKRHVANDTNREEV